MSIENNQTSVNHFMDKFIKSFKRSPVLTSTIMETLKEASSYKLGAKSINIDRQRFDRIIWKISYALFYKEYGYSWNRLLATITNQLKLRDLKNDHPGVFFENLSVVLDILELKGENPSVFRYGFIGFGKGEYDKALFMMFYEGFPFLVVPDAQSDTSSFD